MTKYPNSACEAHRGVKTSDPVCIICMANEIETLKSLERQYTQSLGRMAQLCDTAVPWLIGAAGGGADFPAEIKASVDEIMDYVDAVRP